MDKYLTEEDLIMQPLAPEGTPYKMQCQEKAFAGDIHLAEEVLRLKEKHDLTTVAETGTYIGTTTLWFAKHFDHVMTFEVMEEYYSVARARCKHLDHVQCSLMSGVDFFNVVIYKPIEPQVMLFLDAHPMDGTGRGYDVLIQELEALVGSKSQPTVIVMHDFQVPGHPELQFDKFDGNPFTYEWVKPVLDRMYGENGYTHHFNSEATGAKVGVLFIEKT